MKRFEGVILIIVAVAGATAPVVERLAAQHGPRTAGSASVEQAAGRPSADSSSSSRSSSELLAPITIDYPIEGSLFPPEITAPTFLYRDASETAAAWQIDVQFADGSAGLRVTSQGERLRIGEIDPRCIADTNEPPKLTPQEAATRTWVPDARTWAAIKEHSVGRPATVTITGVTGGNLDQPVSGGRVNIETSKDPVGAPIFYRDVPLMPSELQKGVIKPLAPRAVPLIRWWLRNVGESHGQLIMEGLHTCANCHSFSRDGKTLGMDVDGPQNDKGTYAIVPVAPQMSIRNEDVITWNSYPDKPPGRTTVGYLAQVSPDGQYAVVTLNEEVYVANFKDYRFLQVFYPTRGILAWYNRATGKMKALPGADDPRYVQTNAVWTPDGRYLVFDRAEAREAYPEGRKLAAYANDPNETPLQYDLYRIPFKAGKGGRPEPIPGASQNGMSNTFPKVSPDGRWIVFVQCHNGQLMRPDGQLYIIPAQGGKARRMQCNTLLMNSWHSFSPNGRWMVFSSKSRSPYTQMYLTHLDEEGNDSPAILIENATAANRAVNLPEFVNIPPGGLLGIDVPAAEFYRLFDHALELTESREYEAAIAEWKKALEISPEDAKAQDNLAVVLLRRGRFDEAIPHLQKALNADPGYAEGHYHLGYALDGKGNLDEAIVQWRKAVEIKPTYAEARHSLGGALARQGRLDEAIVQWRKAVEEKPEFVEARNDLGLGLLREGKVDEAIVQWRRAVEEKPEFVEARNNLGVALVRKGRLPDAIADFQKALEVNPDYAEAHYNLGVALAQEGKPDEAINHWQKALELNPKYVEARYSLGVTFYSLGRIPEALVNWREGLLVQPNYLPLLSQTAWALATCSEASVRDGREAVELAERAVQQSGGRGPSTLDTLAASYAEVGRFSDAVQTIRQALTLATQQNKKLLAEALRARLALYEAKTPFREPPQASDPRPSRRESTIDK